MHFTKLLFIFIFDGLSPSSDGFPSLYLDHKDNPDERSGYFEGDIFIESISGRSGLKAVKSRWPNNTIIYVIHNQFAQNEKETIVSAMKEISFKTCIKFKERTVSETGYVFIRRGNPSSGCFSAIGRTGKAQNVNLEAPACLSHGVIIHELVHAIGFVHEQSRPDREEFVDINWANIESGAVNNFQKYSTGVVDTLGVEYDHQSIMHYSAYAFAKDKSQKTIITKNGEPIGQRRGLSEKDVEKINKMYKCQPARNSN